MHEQTDLAEPDCCLLCFDCTAENGRSGGVVAYYPARRPAASRGGLLRGPDGPRVRPAVDERRNVADRSGVPLARACNFFFFSLVTFFFFAFLLSRQQTASQLLSKKHYLMSKCQKTLGRAHQR